MRKFEVPFDITKSARENLVEWVGEDDRMMRMIRHCESHGYPLRFVPGKEWCYIDVLSPGGNPLAVERLGHTMSIDVDADRFEILGDTDIGAGIDRIDEIYAEYGKIAASRETRTLLKL